MSSLEKVLPLPAMPVEQAREILIETVYREVTKTGLKKAIVGVSGGIDSALSLFIAKEALGPENVLAVLMPYKTSSSDSLTHGKLVTKTAGVEQVEVEITGMVDGYLSTQKDINRMRAGNVMARSRMIVLYDLSAEFSALVIGTSNKTESLLGYSTLWGDMASAINPLGDLYKFQVRLLSRAIGVPSEVVDKPPSADLWEGQSDEQELGMSYDLIDRILIAMLESGLSVAAVGAKLEAAGMDPAIAGKIWKRIAQNQYKRRMPLIAKLSDTTINREFRYPRDWWL